MPSKKRETEQPTRQHGLVIELCGLPGSGKSTLAHTLIQELESRGNTVRAGASAIAPTVPAPRRIPVKAVLALAEILAHPRCTAACIAAIARTDQRSVADLSGSAIKWIVTQRLLRAARSEPGVHVVDEGALQALWSIGLRGNLTPVLRKLASSPVWGRPDLVILVEAPLDVVSERLALRGSRHARTQFLDPVRQRIELEYGERLLGRLVEWWRATNRAGSLAPVRDDVDVAELALRVGQLWSGLRSVPPEPPDRA